MLGENYVPRSTMQCYRCIGTCMVNNEECPRCGGTGVIGDNPINRESARTYPERMRRAKRKEAAMNTVNGIGSYPSTGGQYAWYWDDGTPVKSEQLAKRGRYGYRKDRVFHIGDAVLELYFFPTKARSMHSDVIGVVGRVIAIHKDLELPSRWLYEVTFPSHRVLPDGNLLSPYEENGPITLRFWEYELIPLRQRRRIT